MWRLKTESVDDRELRAPLVLDRFRIQAKKYGYRKKNCDFGTFQSRDIQYELSANPQLVS